VTKNLSAPIGRRFLPSHRGRAGKACLRLEWTSQEMHQLLVSKKCDLAIQKDQI